MLIDLFNPSLVWGYGALLAYTLWLYGRYRPTHPYFTYGIADLWAASAAFTPTLLLAAHASTLLDTSNASQALFAVLVAGVAQATGVVAGKLLYEVEFHGLRRTWAMSAFYVLIGGLAGLLTPVLVWIALLVVIYILAILWLCVITLCRLF